MSKSILIFINFLSCSNDLLFSRLFACVFPTVLWGVKFSFFVSENFCVFYFCITLIPRQLLLQSTNTFLCITDILYSFVHIFCHKVWKTNFIVKATLKYCQESRIHKFIRSQKADKTWNPAPSDTPHKRFRDYQSAKSICCRYDSLKMYLEI